MSITDLEAFKRQMAAGLEPAERQKWKALTPRIELPAFSPVSSDELLGGNHSEVTYANSWI